ncbi:MAG: Ig-like domain-containing protein [Candidatus Bathyarchaeia archaeon]
MKRKPLITTVTAVIVVASLYTPHCYSADCYVTSYYLLENFNSPKLYKLNVAVSKFLYEYYRGMDHRQVSVEDFAKFVTPFPLKPIADKLWEIYRTFEDFANGVLMIVHQIPYEFTIPAKYPIETLVENAGDCDLLSYVAASIMKAGGLDVVLLYYPGEAHMNVGVYLPTPPQHARQSIHHVTYKGISYYVAECTGDNWMVGWRVGECPDSLLNAECQIIPLEIFEEWTPQVSASYKSLSVSTISLTASFNIGIQGTTFILSGQLLPKMQNKSVTIYFRVGGSSWSVLAVTRTNAEGKFSWAWIAEEAGIYQFRASWSGDDDYSCADSPTITVTVLSTLFLLMFVVAIVSVCISIIIFFTSSQSAQEIREPTLPSA